jgi:hypothetical protein
MGMGGRYLHGHAYYGICTVEILLKAWYNVIWHKKIPPTKGG